MEKLRWLTTLAARPLCKLAGKLVKNRGTGSLPAGQPLKGVAQVVRPAQ